MTAPQLLFQLTPIEEKPEVFGAYICMMKNRNEIYFYFFDMDGWHFDEGHSAPELWFKPVPNIQSGGHSFIQYHPDIVLPDGIYNGKYNKEPAIIRIHGGEPTYVSFMGFINADGEDRPSSIFDKKGILASSVEILLRSQVLSEGCFM